MDIIILKFVIMIIGALIKFKYGLIQLKKEMLIKREDLLLKMVLFQ